MSRANALSVFLALHWAVAAHAGEPYMVRDLTPGPLSSGPLNLIELQGVLMFAASTPLTGTAICASRGTFDSTGVVADLAAGVFGASPTNFTHVGSSLAFSSGTGVAYETRLWRTSGPFAVPVPIATFGTSTHPCYPCLSELTPMQDQVLFLSYVNSYQSQVWMSGSEPGSARVIRPNIGLVVRSNLLVWHDQILFIGESSSVANEMLWRSDGTDIGTYPIVQIPVPVNSGRIQVVSLGERILFGSGNADLWVSDGTAAGTQQLIGSPRSVFSLNSAVYDHYLYFVGQAPVSGLSLWRTDGTPGGTGPFSTALTMAASSTPAQFTSADNGLYFTATITGSGRELCFTDGTGAGTRIVREIAPGPLGSNPSGLYFADGMLYFHADDGIHGREMWMSDGTTEGTRLVADVAHGSAGSDPSGFTLVGDHVYFAASDGRQGNELWALPLYPTCPADFNHDDVVDFFDYLDFVAAVDQHLPSADFDHDGVFESSDFIDFLFAFSNGC